MKPEYIFNSNKIINKINKMDTKLILFIIYSFLSFSILPNFTTFITI